MKCFVLAFFLALFAQTTLLSAQEHPSGSALATEQEQTSEVFCLEEEGENSEIWFDIDPWCDPEQRWYFKIDPGYLSFTDSDLQQFFDGGFTMRAETGYRFYGPFAVWIDAGYFQKEGKSIGRNRKIELKLATLTLGIKAFYYFNSCVAVYGGAGPRLFMLMMHNDSPFVRGDDNEIGIGGGFDAGVWLFPVPQWPNFFLDAFGDYSWKKMHVTPDEISSTDNDVGLNSISLGLGLGFRF